MVLGTCAAPVDTHVHYCHDWTGIEYNALKKKTANHIFQDDGIILTNMQTLCVSCTTRMCHPHSVFLETVSKLCFLGQITPKHLREYKNGI